MPATTPSPTEPTPAPNAFPAQALEVLQRELLAIHPRELLGINVDVAAAALVVIGAAPEIRGYRAELVALCGEEMTKSVDRLEIVARAALQAHAAHRTIEGGIEVHRLSTELRKIREGLLAEVRALIARDALPAETILELQGPHGFKNQCVDVLQLVSILKDEWDVLAPETGLTALYLDRAEAAANALATAVGIRNQAARSPAAELRQRAYTLMATTYDDARRMLTFLRWREGDADRIAPSLFRGRGNGRRRKPTQGSDVAPQPAHVEVLSPDLPGAPPFLEG